MTILNKISHIMLRIILTTVLVTGFSLTTFLLESKAATSDMTYCGGKFHMKKDMSIFTKLRCFSIISSISGFCSRMGLYER